MDNLQQSIKSHEKNILKMPKAMEVSSITQMQNDKGSCTYASSSNEIVDIKEEVHQSHVDINKEEGEISKLPKSMEVTFVSR
jgi:hypothetical protein